MTCLTLYGRNRHPVTYSCSGIGADMPSLTARLMTVLAALTLGLTLPGCTTNRSFGSGLDDQSADLTLKRKLLTDRMYNYSDVDITVFEGRLLLTGTVKSTEARNSLAAKAQSIPTVSEVLNEVTIGKKTGFRRGTQDAVIDERLGAAIFADNGIVSANYQIAVSGGTIYLLGVAQGPEELARVTSHAQTIPNVNNIVSHVVFVKDPRRK